MINNLIQITLSVCIVVLVMMTLWYILALFLRRMDIVDIAWGLGFIGISFSIFFSQSEYTWRGLLIMLMVSVWGLRLARHLYSRISRSVEDKRYQAFREHWKSSTWWKSFFNVFMLQGVLMTIISVSVVLIIASPNSTLSFWDVLGVCIWITGWLVESTADRQVKQFISVPENRGKLLMSGLWKFSRHPNYFGELTQWWGIWVMSLAVPMGWITFFAPLTLTILIRYVSGVPLLEKNYAGKPGWEEYRRRTSILIPWIPKKI